MGLCTYFLNNTCRFGSQCKNEHINVKLLVKTDVDTVIKANQWMLSCYGPFRDKPCVPNFIEDQSFEEMRSVCYDAKTTGTLPNVVLQIGQQLQDAKNKMGLLYEVNNQTLQIIANLYNAGETAPLAPVTSSSSNNPFAIGASATTPTASTTASIFGQTSAAANPFGGANGSVFGGGSTVGNVFGGGAIAGNVFGGGGVAAVTAPSTGIFGGASAFGTPAATSVFGGVVRPTTSAFGAAATPAAAGGSIFGQSASVAAASSPFSTTANIFGQSTAVTAPVTNSVFGGAATFSQPSGIFGGVTNQQPVAAGGQSIFGQSSVFGGGSQSSVFGSISAQPVFGGGAPVAAVPSVFGTVLPTAATQPSQSIFASVPATVTQSGNVFGQTAAAVVPTQQNVFGAVATAVAPPNPFASAAPFGSAANASQAAPTIFGDSSTYQTFGSAAPQQTFASNPFQSATTAQPATAPTDETLYSKIHEITEEQRNWFNADHFDLGRIPTCPPPRELCV